MTRRALAFWFAGGLVLLLWLFTGVERIAREHGEIDYELFAKQAPSFKVLFENTAQCGECDLRPWALMSQNDQSRFADYCAARFGLDQVRPCYAIFEEKQRMATERLARPGPAQ
ncbi:hypothetical protein CAL29_23515 [Bordetella genomosp. 10]|uniref:Uncharacterized protein n=1 Tax=Bordetella genomosp. 10 TaxID=1416804 RepID=A0A261S1A2_9BORD|nr:hypothetical protein [Bordetella genomosp. 10]OZI30931.1 hypothetical protein CAL29_23515 [Bordetella genomosp. 10]